MAAAFQGLLGSLPAATRLVVLVQASAKSVVEAWLKAAGKEQAELNTFEDTLNISIWAEDAFVVAKDTVTGATFFVEPYSFPRYADGLIGDFVANFTDLRDTRAPLYFQGGNTLIGDDFFFIGADYPARSLQYISSHVLTPPVGVSAKEFVKSAYKDYLDKNRKIIYVGSRVPVPQETTRKFNVSGEEWTETLYAGNAQGTTQPLFHIDMFITLVGRGDAGKYKVLVGDPKMAFKTLGRPAPLHAMVSVFDDIASGLADQGFDVVRNPLPLVYMDDPQNKERRWYFATSNNALVQNGPKKEVWLPTYGYGDWTELKKTDDENATIWEELGFAVHRLPDFHPFAENLGAVHCIKKYLARSQPATS